MGKKETAASERGFSQSEGRLHYVGNDPVGLSGRILDALRKAGKDLDRLRPEDLASIDEFHTLGRMATLELAEMAGISEATGVLDVGCGVGGPSRTLAAERGCPVTGVDLVDDYCVAARMLTRLVGLSGLVEFFQADALKLPFPDGAFHVVWSQHAAMNVDDKAALYREMNRVLKPGGTLALFDVLANPDGPPGPIHLPVPWARTAAMSILVSPKELRAFLAESGFALTGWNDVTDTALRVFEKLEGRVRQGGLPPLGTHILVGPDFEAMVVNQLRNFQEQRISVIQVAARKQSLSESTP